MLLQLPACAALKELQKQDLMLLDSEVAKTEIYQAIMKPDIAN